MDDVRETGQPPVYHDPELAPELGHDPETDALVAELWPAGPPRLFALVDSCDDENDQVVWEVKCYGIALPDGPATTVGATGSGWASWRDADSACQRTNSDLVWLSR